MRKEYEVLLPILRTTALQHGYALGVHGSGERDLDLIAAPWVEGRSAPAELVEGLRLAVHGVIELPERFPVKRPLGRLVWVIHIGGGRSIDLSVCPAHERVVGARAAVSGAGGLRDDERAVMDYLVAAWKTFMHLDRAISLDDQAAFRDAIHAAQGVLGQWALARTFPDYWNGEDV